MTKVKVLLGVVTFFLLRALLLMPIVFSAHATLVNGDFGTNTIDDISGIGWVDFSLTGSATIGGGVATLATGDGDDPFSASLTQGDFVYLFLTPISLAADVVSLSFDALFTESVDTTETIPSTGPGTDFLTVSIFDELDITGLSDLIFVQDIDFSLSSTFSTFSFDVSSLAGRTVGLYFDLADEANGMNYQVQLDNVSFNAAPGTVPEPGTIYLFLIGIMGSILTLTLKKQRQV